MLAATADIPEIDVLQAKCDGGVQNVDLGDGVGRQAAR
jgi:hypothetical protein